MATLNILIYEPYPFGEISGSQRTQRLMMKFVNKKKFYFVYVAPFETDFTENVRLKGIDTVVIEPPKRINRYGGKCLKDSLGGKILTIFDIIRYNFKLYKLLKGKNIDVVYCNCIRGVLTVGLLALLRRGPILWYIGGELQNPLLDAIGFLISQKVLFICQANKNDKYPILVKLFNYKIGILEIGIDPDSVKETQQSDKSKVIEELGITKKNINLIYAGQIYAPKGIHFLLEAITFLKEEFPNIRLYIVGSHIIEEYKNYKNELNKIIELHGMGTNVIFTGWRADALQIICLMDILIHPSLSEGLARVVMEGMALGKPVVASKVGGLRELIKDGENGFLVEPGNPQMIAEKLRLLLRDKDLRENIGEAARKTVFSGYLIQDKILQLEKIWIDMIPER